MIHQSGSEYFLLQNLGFFSDSEESLKLFSNYPSMISNTRSSSQTQSEREKELRIWSFGFSFSSATSAEAWELPVSSGGGVVCVDLPSSQVLRIRGSGSRF